MKESTGAIIGLCTAFALAAGITTCRNYDVVPSQNFGVRVTMGQMVSDQVQPGSYWTKPWFDDIYHFSNNTVIMEPCNIASLKISAHCRCTDGKWTGGYWPTVTGC